MVAAIIIGASAAVSAYSAHKASQASKQAGEQQAASAQQGIDLQRQMYQQTRSDLGPYRTQGGQSLTSLTSFLGMPPQQAPPPVAPPPGAGAPAGAMSPGMPPPGAAGTPGAMPPGGAPSMGGGMVMLRAPTGQTQAVPADQAAYYLSRGATRLS